MQVEVKLAGGIAGTLTIDHATSSYGVPVLVLDGIAYGPSDAVPERVRRATGVDGPVGLLGLDPVDEPANWDDWLNAPLRRAWLDACDNSTAVQAASLWP